MDEQLISLWGKRVTDLARTYVHNLTRPARSSARFERAAVSDTVDASALPEFRQFLELEGQAFLERVDAWLTEHRARRPVGSGGPEQNADGVRLGVGLYHIQD